MGEFDTDEIHARTYLKISPVSQLGGLPISEGKVRECQVIACHHELYHDGRNCAAGVQALKVYLACGCRTHGVARSVV